MRISVQGAVAQISRRKRKITRAIMQTNIQCAWSSISSVKIHLRFTKAHAQEADKVAATPYHRVNVKSTIRTF